MLGKFHGNLLLFPGLMIMIPPSIGMRGNIYGALGARIGTRFHAGELGKTSGFLKVKPKEQVIEPTPKIASGAPSKKPQGIKTTEKS